MQCAKGQYHGPQIRVTSQKLSFLLKIQTVPFRDGKTVSNTGSSIEPGCGGLRVFRTSLFSPWRLLKFWVMCISEHPMFLLKCASLVPSWNSAIFSKHTRQKMWARWTYWPDIMEITPSLQGTIKYWCWNEMLQQPHHKDEITEKLNGWPLVTRLIKERHEI